MTADRFVGYESPELKFWEWNGNQFKVEEFSFESRNGKVRDVYYAEIEKNGKFLIMIFTSFTKYDIFKQELDTILNSIELNF